MTKPSEAVRILLALIEANRELVHKEDFRGWVFDDHKEGRIAKQYYKQGAMDVLYKLEKQLKGDR